MGGLWRLQKLLNLQALIEGKWSRFRMRRAGFQAGPVEKLTNWSGGHKFFVSVSNASRLTLNLLAFQICGTKQISASVMLSPKQ